MSPKIENFSQGTADLEAWFANNNAIYNYGSQAETWRALAEPMANIGQEPPPPPQPPMAVAGYVDADGNAALKPTDTPVCAAVPAIHAKPGVGAGVCAIQTGYQDPNTLRIWVSTQKDTAPVGYVATVSGVKGIKDGVYVKKAMTTPMPSWVGPGYYDPQ